MTVTGRGWVEALAAVRSARPCAGPNLGFLRQLEEFENTDLTEVSRDARILRNEDQIDQQRSRCATSSPCIRQHYIADVKSH